MFLLLFLWCNRMYLLIVVCLLFKICFIQPNVDAALFPPSFSNGALINHVAGTISSTRLELFSHLLLVTKNVSMEADTKRKKLLSFLPKFPLHMKEIHANPSDMHKNLISQEEMLMALDSALRYVELTTEQIKSQGWNIVHVDDQFSLFKRRDSSSKSGAVIYLMLGRFENISPRSFLYSQINSSLRKLWDTTMQDMSPITSKLLDIDADGSEDILYFRTKWPWPLKDRDYVLSRRAQSYSDMNAIVFTSKSTEVVKKSRLDGVIRVDNYWCYSTLISNPHKGPMKVSNFSRSHSPIKMEHVEKLKKTKKSKFDQPGMILCTIFCDDQKVPLPSQIIDLLSKHAERLVPESVRRLCDVSEYVGA